MEQKNDNKINQQIEELTLLLLYLTSWIEKVSGDAEGIHRSWKGYPFEILNILSEKNLLYQTKHLSKNKSVYITEEGIEKAKELMKKYLK